MQVILTLSPWVKTLEKIINELLFYFYYIIYKSRESHYILSENFIEESPYHEGESISILPPYIGKSFPFYKIITIELSYVPTVGIWYCKPATIETFGAV